MSQKSSTSIRQHNQLSTKKVIMFNTVKTYVSTRSNNGVTIALDIALPAINETVKDKNGNDTNKVKADPNLSAQNIIDVLLDSWGEDQLKELILTRLVSVVAVDRGRQEMIKILESDPTIKKAELTSKVQTLYDENWNVSLKHPIPDRSKQKAERDQKNAVALLQSMSQEQLAQLGLKRA